MNDASLGSTPQGSDGSLAIISMGCRDTLPSEYWGWHTHDYDEICLFSRDCTSLGLDGDVKLTRQDTLCLFRKGERHGFWNSAYQSPKLWALHFRAGDWLYDGLECLSQGPTQSKVWRLTTSQVQDFAGLFAKLSAENVLDGSDASVARSSWLRLILVAMSRWAKPGDAPTVNAHTGDRELQQLWLAINDTAAGVVSETPNWETLVPNYDSLRHRFRKEYGLSPNAMRLRMRMQMAQSLLMDGERSVKEVARSVGYVRQNEFTRAFTKCFGVSPTQWRTNSRVFS